MRHVVFALVLAACARDSHVALGPTPASPTPAQRVRLFEQYRSKTEVEEVARECDRRRCTDRRRPMLVLASGDEVRHAEDLAPLVAASTETGQALAKIRRTKARRAQWAIVGWTGLLAGVVVATVGLARESIPLELGGAAVALTVGGVGTLGVVLSDARIREQNERAFGTYDASLARTLDLCVDGLTVVPCPH